jgi:energy-coupling factor transporter ATP-binding protein EcfA2
MGRVYRISKPAEYKKAGTTDLIEMLPVPGHHALYIPKHIIESLVYGITSCEFVHLSGPTGSAKSSLIEALNLVPENFNSVCTALGFPVRPLQLYPVEMVTYEAPGELYQRRALRDGTTYDEKSRVAAALEEAEKNGKNSYSLVWLREIGRVHSSSVQGGLLNLMTKGDIVMPDNTRINGHKLSWIADSNYQAEHDSTHTLVTFDDALRRRFAINITMDYLSLEQEVQVLENIFRERGGNGKINLDLIIRVVQLGNAIRQQRSEGNLRSLIPPTIYGYIAFLRMASALPHFSVQQVAQSTLLGNASMDDRKKAASVFNEVFGLQSVLEEDEVMGGNFF